MPLILQPSDSNTYLTVGGTNAYINFNYSAGFGSSGYGFRDSVGTIEVKNSGGSWVPIISPTTTYSSNIVISALTTAPASALIDQDKSNVRYQLLGDQYEITYKIHFGGGNLLDGGSGDYIFELPSELSFNSSLNPFYTGATQDLELFDSYLVVNSYGFRSIQSTDELSTTVCIVPYSTSYFRVGASSNLTSSAFKFLASDYYNISYSGQLILTFKFFA